ncbi:helix-turn-helix domain-containing protein [Flavobacterium sp.]|uniref:helix-turn-helix domain-containing protein n=1 Tax=Flavobacterium sp. TaxID=239 RepID=UPI00374D598B
MSTITKSNHIGRKISRIRELRDMKQEVLAQALGISQQTISALENSETIEDERLAEIAKVLGVTAEGIKNFSEEAVLNIIGNTVNNHDNASSFNYSCSFNVIDKLMEVYQEKEALYERLLKAEKDRNDHLENLLTEK